MTPTERDGNPSGARFEPLDLEDEAKRQAREAEK
jgi:hypothetical protein